MKKKKKSKKRKRKIEMVKVGPFGVKDVKGKELPLVPNDQSARLSYCQRDQTGESLMSLKKVVKESL